MNITAAMMVMPDWRIAVCVPISIGVRSLVRREMDVRVMFAIRFAQGDGGPVGGMADRVL